MPIGMDDVEQTHNVGVVHLLEEGNFANCSAGDAFVLGLETDLLQSYDSCRVCEVPSLVDNTVCALSMMVSISVMKPLRKPPICTFVARDTDPRQSSPSSGNSPSRRGGRLPTVTRYEGLFRFIPVVERTVLGPGWITLCS